MQPKFPLFFRSFSTPESQWNSGFRSPLIGERKRKDSTYGNLYSRTAMSSNAPIEN